MAVANIDTLGSKPYIVEDRPMISRSSGDRVKITHTIEPGKEETGCVTCFYAPPEYPVLAACCPCFDYPEYIVNEMKASRYIYVRENGVEWNNPTMQPAKGPWCGRSLTDLRVRDDVRVMYFDDVRFDSVRNDTRVCNPFLTFCCGGNGEDIRLESKFCWNACYRTHGGCLGDGGCGSGSGCCVCVPCCVPACCPKSVCPCAAKEYLYVEDAKRAKSILCKARDDARIRMQVMDR